jgi:legumain
LTSLRVALGLIFILINICLLGCGKDYTGNTVTADNFIHVITGNASAVTGGNGKVLQSGSEDNVFIYFTDHGGPNIS